MHFAGDSCTVDIGSNVFTTTFASLSDDRLVVLAIDDIRVVSFTHVDGQLLLDMVLHDEEDKRIFEVVESQLTYASNELWDIEFVGRIAPGEYDPNARNRAIKFAEERPPRLTEERAPQLIDVESWPAQPEVSVNPDVVREALARWRSNRPSYGAARVDHSAPGGRDPRVPRLADRKARSSGGRDSPHWVDVETK